MALRDKAIRTALAYSILGHHNDGTGDNMPKNHAL